MDRTIYTAMAGAKGAMSQLAATSHNLANVQTPGFRAVLAQYRAVDVTGAYADARVSMVDSTPGAQFQSGPFVATDRPLDVTLREQGMFSLLTPWGETVQTRDGRFSLNEEGVLTGARGWPVLGLAGPIQIGKLTHDVRIQADGSVWGTPEGQTQAQWLGQLKLVSPPSMHEFQRRPDGTFSTPQALEHDPQIRLMPGGHEQSNVMPTETMVQMIENSRLFDLNLQLIKSADQNSKSADSLLTLTRN